MKNKKSVIVMAWIAAFPMPYLLLWLATSVIKFDAYNYWNIQDFSVFSRFVCAGVLCALWAVMLGIPLFHWVIGVPQKQWQAPAENKQT